jgi:hypothetical protein
VLILGVSMIAVLVLAVGVEVGDENAVGDA